MTKTAQLTREEFQQIEGKGAPSKLDKNASNYSIEESMDPPSFTRNLCKRKLELQDNLEEIHKMIEEKASLIEEKLEKKKSVSHTNEE